MAIRIDNWDVTKPAVTSDKGVVASQSAVAAEAGASILRSGGNAIDAAVATALALTVVEPWGSGIGGGGFAVVHLAKEERTVVLDYGMKSPQGLDPAWFEMQQGGSADDDLFGWPGVIEDRNVEGYRSMCVPGAVAGLGKALEAFGTKSWQEVIAPALELAETGVPLDWWTMVRIASEAARLRNYPMSREIFLPDGLPPVPADGTVGHLDVGPLKTTLKRLAEAGPRDFYEGELARQLAADIQSGGGWITTEDLAAYDAHIVEPLTRTRDGVTLNLTPGLTAGPTFADTLDRLAGKVDAETPEPARYAAFGEAMIAAYRQRLETMGHDGDTHGQASTSHFSVVDGDGNMVAFTNTLLSIFGSRVVLPGTGVLMNNGVMWFDPRPGKPNSLKGGVRPLTNMCPVIATKDGAPLFAAGASGGRKIYPAVFQLCLSMIDEGLSMEEALARPRINVEGQPPIEVDPRFDDAVKQALREIAEIKEKETVTFPVGYAFPSITGIENGRPTGAAHPRVPAAAAVPA
ncbi:MAG: gamma-glutamyltransferase family protein [Alphaproteobacteria bacterium]|nr:gamma-glutamyltransferase family protein [Alphaproteobacteria bacterium]